jgi:hypothetical protein
MQKTSEELKAEMKFEAIFMLTGCLFPLSVS